MNENGGTTENHLLGKLTVTGFLLRKVRFSLIEPVNVNFKTIFPSVYSGPGSGKRFCSADSRSTIGTKSNRAKNKVSESYDNEDITACSNLCVVPPWK